MRTSRLNVAIGFLAISPLMSALAACDEAQESTPITEVSTMGEAAVVAGTAPEAGLADPAASPSEGEAATARQDATSADDAATPASRRAASPASRATAKRCKTEFVEPPVATANAIPFSSDFLVRICREVIPV